MDNMKNDNAKAANQAWRRRPRQFAPKSRLGCKTCKIRRVKCDLSRPSCSKCKSTGRTCDGYSEMPYALKTEIGSKYYDTEKTNSMESRDTHYSLPITSAIQPNTWCAKLPGLGLRNPAPFMILPVTGSAQTETMRFFEYISLKHLNEYQPCESWRNNLMLFSQTVPSVRYAALALALIYRNYIDRDCTGRVREPQTLNGWLPDKTPLLHYNRAIQLLLDQQVGDNSEKTAITLLVCYLLTCFDQLAGNYVQAIKHLRGGVEISRKVDKAILNSENSNDVYDYSKQPGPCSLIRLVTRQIRRLDIQAAIFLVDWTPAEMQEILISRSLPANRAFESLDQAADHLQILIAQVMRLRHAEYKMTPTSTTPTTPSPVRDAVLGQLEKWSRCFENMVQEGNLNSTNFEIYRLIPLLRLQHATAWTFLSSSGPEREMAYDNFLPQFQQCVALLRDVAAEHQRYSGSLKPTFTPEIGILPVLYIIGAKCRHPKVRRDVLRILRRQLIREAVWDSVSVAKVIERLIEIEEGGSVEGEQIPVWQRIEAVSWVQFVDGQATDRVDLTYTFCMREGIHTESLMIHTEGPSLISSNR